MVVTIAAAVPREEKFAELSLREAGNPNPKQEVAARRSADNVTGIPVSNSSVNATTPSPTSPSNVYQGRALQEVKFEGGKAGTSSRYGEGELGNPEYAFDGDAYASDEGYWYSGRSKKGKGQHQTFPHLIWYDFGERQIVPGEVGIRGLMGTAPTMWDFIGSNDKECGKYSAWTILCSDRSGKPFQTGLEMKYCDVDEKIKGSFRCLGIRVLNFEGGKETYKYPTSSVATIRMWANVNA